RLPNRAPTRTRCLVGRHDRPTARAGAKDAAMNAKENIPKIVQAGAMMAIAVLVVACAKPEPAPEAVRPVQLMQVKPGGITGTAVFAGEVKPRHEIDLGFRIGGKVIGRSVDVGARVTRGQALARLDPSDVALQADA